jgi:hypothetical protein
VTCPWRRARDWRCPRDSNSSSRPERRAFLSRFCSRQVITGGHPVDQEAGVIPLFSPGHSQPLAVCPEPSTNVCEVVQVLVGWTGGHGHRVPAGRDRNGRSPRASHPCLGSTAPPISHG